MGNQCSEMKSQYTGRPGVNLDTAYNAGIQPFNLADHHREGNSKVKKKTLLFCSFILYHIQANYKATVRVNNISLAISASPHQLGYNIPTIDVALNINMTVEIQLKL